MRPTRMTNVRSTRRLLVPGILMLGVVAAGAALSASPPNARAAPAEVDEVSELPVLSEVAVGSHSEDDLGWVVDLADGVDPSEVGSALGLDLRDPSAAIKDDANLAVVKGLSSDAVRALRKDRRVEGIERIVPVFANFVPNDPKYSEQWHMKQVGAEAAWEYSCGRGVTVAVIDTGVACFDANGFSKGTDLNETRCVAGYNFVSDNKNAGDDHGHGTHVAGTIAQSTNNGVGVAGLAHCAKLMPVKVLSGTGSGSSVGVAEGIRFAADHGAQIMNLSLGSSSPSKVIEDAVVYAQKKGVLIVAAAGNSGRSVGYPAAYPGVVAVSATDRNDGLAWFSSRGPQVSIGAPGVAVVQQTVCNGGKNKCEVFGSFNGTSMASPHVAGAAAMLMGMGVSEPNAVKQALFRAAAPKENKEHFGAGVLRVDAAARNVAFSHLMTRVFALFALWFGLKVLAERNRSRLATSPATLFSAVVFGVGALPFAPWVHLETMVPAARPLVEMLARPVPEWPALLDVSLGGYVLVLGALLPVIGLMLGYGAKAARPWIGGFALGGAAHALSLAYFQDASFPLGPTMLRIVMMFSVLLLAATAWIALSDDKRLSTARV
jgi:serine protease